VTAVRLSKLMAERGLCSRREADELIAAGLVRVDGVCIDKLGTRVDPAGEITLDPRATERLGRAVTVLLHKPVGYVSGQPEKGYPPAASLVRAANRDPADSDGAALPRDLSGLAPAGRLDIDSTGLLVLTQDGRVARTLIGPGSRVEKEYLVRVSTVPTAPQLARLRHGLALDGRALAPAGVDVLEDGLLRMTLVEGRKRQIRRMCELVDLRVTGLKRVRIGRVRLGRLPLGQWRLLRPGERF